MGGQRGGEVEEVKRRKSRKRKEERRGEEMLKEARARQVRERMAERVKEGKERKRSGPACRTKDEGKRRGKEEGRRAAGHTSRPGNKEAKIFPSSPSPIRPSIPDKHKFLFSQEETECSASTA